MTPERLRLADRLEELRMLRSGIQPVLESVQRLVRPNGSAFDNSSKQGGMAQEDGSKYKFDDTAVWANQMFANGMCSYLMPKSSRWAYLKPAGKPSSELTDEELIYLEQVSDMISHSFALPKTGFYEAGHEVYMDQGSYGTAILYNNRSARGSQYTAVPLSMGLFDTSDDGDVDTMFYIRKLRTKAMIQAFPDIVNAEGFDPSQGDRTYSLVYSVEPSRDVRAKKGGTIGANKPYQFTYWCEELKDVLQEGTLSYFPFIVPRWAKLPGEVYGRSPAMTCLSTIQMVNKMRKELIKSAEISNAPPLTAEEDTIMLPFSYGSRQMIWREPGSPAPEPVLSGSQPNLTQEMINQDRDTIVKAFFVDQIIRDQKKERQTILEIQDERGQMLQQLGPLLSRQENEFLSPCVEAQFDFLDKSDKLPPVPSTLEGHDMEIVYTSPAAQAQYSSGMSNISAMLQDIIPLAQAKPEIMDNIDDNELFAEISRLRNVTRRIVKTKDDVNAVREQRAEAEQQQQTMDNIPGMAGAAKDVADAKATDPEGIGQMLQL
jgi:hypothetical protein